MKPNHKQDLTDNSTAAQRQRILTALRLSPITTLEARQELNIMHPGGRVLELRKEGYEIITHRSVEYTNKRERHSVAKYVLISEAKK